MWVNVLPAINRDLVWITEHAPSHLKNVDNARKGEIPDLSDKWWKSPCHQQCDRQRGELGKITGFGLLGYMTTIDVTPARDTYSRLTRTALNQTSLHNMFRNGKQVRETSCEEAAYVFWVKIRHYH